MTIRVAINGYGRIGRNILRAIYENGYNNKVKIVAINDLTDIKVNAHLTRYDTVHGRFGYDVSVDSNHLVVNGDPIVIAGDRNPANLPWKDLAIDIIYECTGQFRTKEKAMAHVQAGAKKVLISAPGGSDVDATVVYGVNEHILKPEHTIVSNASCTTNCLAPVAKVLHEKIGIVSGMMNTIHAYTNDQVLTDVAHSDLRRARSATQSMIPTKTGAAAAVGLVLPELAGRLDGLAVRVPTINVSLVDFTFIAERETSIDEINTLLYDACQHEMAGIIAYNEEPLVSVDFNHTPCSSNFDATQTKVIGKQVKIMAWYDNEWGFSNRMIDTSLKMM